MAKQDFINGGFIGKLGGIVGQRFKKKYYIRAYVKPKNPKTPEQAKVRGTFKTAVYLAQEAMKINGHEGLWPSDTRTEFQSRVSWALERLHEGKSEAEAFPLFPDAAPPQTEYKLQSIYFDASGQVKATIAGQAPSENLACRAVLIGLELDLVSHVSDLLEFTLTPQDATYTLTFPQPKVRASCFVLTASGGDAGHPAHNTWELDPWEDYIGFENAPPLVLTDATLEGADLAEGDLYLTEPSPAPTLPPTFRVNAAAFKPDGSTPQYAAVDALLNLTHYSLNFSFEAEPPNKSIVSAAAAMSKPLAGYPYTLIVPPVSCEWPEWDPELKH